MAQPLSPTSPKRGAPFVDRSGSLTDQGLYLLEQFWRQIAAGYVVVPVTIAGTNALTLTPVLAREGAASYGDHMMWCGPAANTSTGPVTATVTDGTNALTTVKCYKTGGSAQADTGDIVADRLFLFTYYAALDSGSGGLVVTGL